MHLSINISEDKELRKFIKGLIKEQVKSVMREEITEILKALITQKWFPKDDSSMEKLVKELMREMIESSLKQHWGHYVSDSDVAHSLAKEAGTEYIKELFTKVPAMKALVNVLKASG